MRKKFNIPAVITGLIVCACLYGQDKNTIRKTLFTIGQGEKPVYSECSILLSSQGSSVSIVTKNGDDQYYFYENGKRKGLFTEAKETGWKVNEEDRDMNSSIYAAEGYLNQEGLIEYNDEGKMVIKSGGKTYGPFSMILNLFTDHDRKMTAAVTAEGMEAKLLTTGGTQLPLEGIPSHDCVSPSGKKVLIVVVKEYNPSLEFTGIDFSRMNTEQIMKLSREIEEKQKNAPPPQAYIYLNDGKKFGPYPKEAISGNNPAFCKTGGENWFMTIEGKLYLNGSQLASLGNDYISNDDIWISPDGKRYAIITYDYVRFSDGSSYKFPIAVKRTEKEGRIWFNWVSLENEKDIVLYSKAL